MASAIGIGYMQPSPTEMIYRQQIDRGSSHFSNIVLRDVGRNLEGQLTPRFGVSALAKWSPDGQQIAYLTLYDAGFRVYVMDAMGQNNRQLDLQFTSLDSGYVWSPDGKFILFSVTVEGSPQSLLLNVATGQTSLLPQPIGSGMWSPDSQTILYQAATENGTSHLYGMNIKCLADAPSCLFHPVDMLEGETTYDNLAWSLDGKAIVFSQQEGSDTRVMVARLRCQDLSDACVDKTTIIGSGPLIRAPIWSPDSQQIAYIYDINTIKTVQVATGETRSFYTPDLLPALRDWSPDGRYIAYFSTLTGAFNVYLLDTFDGTIRPLFANAITNELPEWRPLPH